MYILPSMQTYVVFFSYIRIYNCYISVLIIRTSIFIYCSQYCTLSSMKYLDVLYKNSYKVSDSCKIQSNWTKNSHSSPFFSFSFLLLFIDNTFLDILLHKNLKLTKNIIQYFCKILQGERQLWSSKQFDEKFPLFLPVFQFLVSKL